MTSFPSSPLPVIVVVEDDESIGRQLSDALSAAGYRTRWNRTGAGGLAAVEDPEVAVAVLDLGLPDGDGVDIARRMRALHPGLLILILTARSEDMDVVVGLDAGADDYLTKPFSMTVLLARLRAHLRSQPPSAARTTRTVGVLRVDPASRRAHLLDLEIDLRPKELDLLLALTEHPGQAISREALMAQVWDENWFGSTKTLDVTMAALRLRLRTASVQAGIPEPVITTLRGHGYRLEQAPDGPA